MAGKFVPSSLIDTLVEFPSTGPVIRDGATVENDHSTLMMVEDKELWVHKSYPFSGDKVTVSMQFAIDNKLQVEGVNDEEEIIDESRRADKTVKPSLGPSTVFSSGLKAGDPDKKEKRP